MNITPLIRAVLFLLRVHCQSRAAVGAPDQEAERIMLDLGSEVDRAESARLERLAGQRKK